MSFLQNMAQRLRSATFFFGGFLANENKGASAIEFAVIAPVFGLILAGSLDLGMVLYARFQLETVATNAASYALVNSGMVTAKDGPDLAKRIAGLIAAEAGNAGSNVIVNNGPDAQYDGIVIQTGGKSQNADKCYCPTGNAEALTWGAPRKCSNLNLCPDGTPAGKFVWITLRQSYKPLFSSYGIITDDNISAAAVVRAE